MTMPPPSFAAVAPPPDGLVLAFTAARRRRNGKAAVSAFGGAVAIASVLSFLAPPGQTLVQEPVPPAHGGLLSNITELPRHGAPAVSSRTPTSASQPATAPSSPVVVDPRSGANRPAARRPGLPTAPCSNGRTLACATLPHVVDGGPSMRAQLCPSSATVTVEYESDPVGPTRVSASRTVDVGGGCRS